MATKRKSAKTTRRRKTGASSKVSGSNTIKVANANGKKSTFSKTSCHTTKSAAKAAAESIRAKGSRAVVRETGGNVCVYKGPKMTAKGKAIYTRTRRAKRA